jgi:hypothetical protein
MIIGLVLVTTALAIGFAVFVGGNGDEPLAPILTSTTSTSSTSSTTMPGMNTVSE